MAHMLVCALSKFDVDIMLVVSVSSLIICMCILTNFIQIFNFNYDLNPQLLTVYNALGHIMVNNSME